MRGEIETLSNGWSQIWLRVRKGEIEQLIQALRELHDDSHFHLRGIFSDDDVPGVVDVEISLQGEDEVDNLTPPE